MVLIDAANNEGECATPLNDFEGSLILDTNVRELSSQSPQRPGKSPNCGVETVKALYAERNRLQRALHDIQLENKQLKERLESKQNSAPQPSASFQKQLQGMLNLGTSKDDMPVLSVILDIKNTLMGFYESLEKVSEQLKFQKDIMQRNAPGEGDRVWRNPTRLTHHDIQSLSTELERRRLKLAGQLYGSQPYDQVDPITDRLISLYLLRDSHEMTAQLEVMKQYVHDVTVLHEVEQQFRSFREAHPMPTMDQLAAMPSKADDMVNRPSFDPSRMSHAIQPLRKVSGSLPSRQASKSVASGPGPYLSVAPSDTRPRRSLSSPSQLQGSNHATRLKPVEKACAPTPLYNDPNPLPGPVASGLKGSPPDIQISSPATTEAEKNPHPFSASPWLAPDKLTAAYTSRMRMQNRRIATKLGV